MSNKYEPQQIYDAEECGSGYNGEEKEPEGVYVNMLYD
jgi:hypothetical protein